MYVWSSFLPFFCLSQCFFVLFFACVRACVCVSFLSFVLQECCHTVCCFQSFMPASAHKLGMYLTSNAYIYIFTNQSSRCTVIFESYISIYRIIYLSCFCVCSSSSCGCVLPRQKTGSPQQKHHSCQRFFVVVCWGGMGGPFCALACFIKPFVGNSGSPYMGTATAAARAALPIIASLCSIFLCS